MHPGKLDMFTYGIGNDFSILCNCIYLNFFCIFNEFRNNYRILF